MKKVLITPRSYGKYDASVADMLRAAGYDGAATLELVTHYIDAPSRYARLALERAKELMV